MIYKFTFVLGILLFAGLVPLFADEPPVMSANNTSPKYYTETNSPVALFPEFTITGPLINGGPLTGLIKGLTISFTSGHHNDQDNLSIPDNPLLGITGSFDKSTGILRLTGETSAQNYQSAVRSITYSNDAASGAISYDQRTMTISLVNADYLESTGHFYEFINSASYWGTAKTAASGKTYYGLQGYLATVTSAEENSFIKGKISSYNIWLGGSDANTEGTWLWTSGPETGNQFSTGATAYNGNYVNWKSGEPNNSSGIEDYLLMNSDGTWNDGGNNTSLRYIVEYGGMDGDPTIDMTTTTTLDLIVPQPPVIDGKNDSPTYNTSDYNPVVAFPNFTVTDDEGSDIKGLTIYFSSAYQSNQDTLLFTNTSKITGSFDDAKGALVLLGDATPSEYQAAMRSITYVNNAPLFSLIDGTQRQFTISLANDDYFSQALKLDDGHFYEYVNASVTWDQANTAASTRTYYGLQGYLATVTSAEENSFIRNKISNMIWLGGSDNETEGTWKWVTGPEGENGTVFYSGGSAYDGNYINWNTANNEPNSSQANEDYLMMYSSNYPGEWNDIYSTKTYGYVVEYGGMTGDPALTMTTTTTLNINIVRPEAPGGIVDNLRVWFNANSGTTDGGGSITNGNITSWEGQKPYDVNTTIVNNIQGDPAVVPNSANFNAAVSFDIDDAIKTSSTAPYTTYFNAISDNNTVFLVKKTTEGKVEAGYGAATGTRDRAGYFERADGYQRADYGKESTIVSGNTTTINKYVIARQDVQPGELSLYLDGALEVQQNVFNSLSGSNDGYLGFGANPTDWTSQSTTDIAEYIIYASDLSATEIKEVESYLALKYGISIDQTVATDYLASDGTVIWSATDNTSYTTDIFGIGRDDASGLNQKVSKSANPDAILFVSLDNDFTSSNQDASRTAIHNSDKQFFILANDGNSTSVQYTEIDASAFNTRIAREWKVDKTSSFTQNVSLKFEGFDDKWTLYKDNDGDFSSGATALGTLDANGEITNISLADGDYLTLARLQEAPGGILTSLLLWLKADIGASGASWVNQVGAGNATQVNASSQPTPSTSLLLNFNPSMVFDGTDDYFRVDRSASLIGTSSLTTFYITQTNSGSASVYSHGTSGGANFGYVMNTWFYPIHGQTTSGVLKSWGDDIPGTAITYVKYNRTQLFAHSYETTSGAIKTYADGLIDINTTTVTNLNRTNTDDIIGTGRSNDGAGGTELLSGFYNGKIGEVIGYTSSLSSADVQKVNSYLAIKYGISLDQTSPLDYLASDGTVIWDATASTDYKTDIFGIGRDDASGLNQKVSKSVNDGSILTLALDADFTSANNDAGRTAEHTNDLQFLTVANNAAALTVQETELDAATGFNIRLAREWKVDATNFTQNISMKFEGYDETWSLIATADGDFSSEVTVIGTLNDNGELTTTTPLTNGVTFTLAKAQPAPGGVASGLQFWVKAGEGAYTDASNTLAGNGDAVLTWSDLSVNGNDASNATSSQQPHFNSNGINFNPALTFNNNDDYLQLSSMTGFPTGANPHTVYTVASNSTTGDFNWAFSYGFNTTHQVVALGRNNNNSTNIAIGHYTDDVISSGNEFAGGTPVVFGTTYNGTSSVLRKPGISVNAKTVSLSVGSNYAYIGRWLDQGNYWNGNIGEIFVYNENLTGTDLQKVESYMALKYGYSMDQASLTDYLASDGTKIWDATTNAGYKTHIFGIGQDNASGLNQKVARSVNDVNGPILATTQNFTASNSDESRTSLGEGNFMLMSHNGATENSFTAGFNGGANNRSARVYKVDETGTVGDVYFAIPYSAATFPSGGSPALVISGDETFDNTDVVVLLTYDRTNRLYWAQIDPADGDYIALATSEISVTYPAYYRTRSDNQTDGITKYSSYQDFIAGTNGAFTLFSTHWSFGDNFFSDGIYFYRTNDVINQVIRYPSIEDLGEDTNGVTFNLSQTWNYTDEFFASGDQFFRTASGSGTHGITSYPSFADLLANTNGNYTPFKTTFRFDDQFFHDGQYFLRTNTSSSDNTHRSVTRYASLSDLANDVVFDNQTFGPYSTNDDIFAVGITAGYTVSKDTLTVNENAGTGIFTVVLDAQPATDVVFDVSSDDINEATVDKPTLTFTTTDWNTPQEVIVTGVDDNVFRKDTATITVAVKDESSDNTFDVLADQTVGITLTDDDTAGFTVSETTLTVDENLGIGTFTVVLNSEPTSDVVFIVSIDDTGEATVSAPSLIFTSENWDTPQTVTVTGVNDDIARDDNAVITVLVDDESSDDAFDALADQTVAVTLTDDDIVPTVSTTTAASITSTSVIMGGNISDSGNSAIIETGVVYSSVNSSPEIEGANVIKETNESVTETYNINISSLEANKLYYFQAYAINSAGTSYGGVQTFTTKKSQTITFNTISDKTYGDSDFDPEASATSSLTIAYSSSDASVATIVDGKIHIVGAGSCTIYADQEGDEDYDVAPQKFQLLTVNKATLTVTAVDKSKTYGEENPELTISYDNFVGTDKETDIDTPPTVTTDATTTSGAGTYTITVAGGTDNNYTFSYTDGTLTVDKATLTVTAVDKSKTYGEANPELTISYDGFVGDDGKTDIETLPTATTSATTTSDAGDYPINVSGGTDNNYTFSYTPGTLTVNKATLTVTAVDKSKTYGEANPELTISYDGFVGDDGKTDIETLPTATTSATTTSDAGDYPINVSGGTDNNYTFSYTAGTLTVNKATLTVTAVDKSKTYGEENPELTISYDNFVGTDKETDIDTPPTVTTDATTTSGAGTYTITVAGGTDNNYTFSYTDGTLTVDKATLTVTAVDKSKTYGEANPKLTISYDGFVGDDGKTDIDTPPTATTSATTTSDAGDYPINVSGGTDDNYTFSYTDGTLTVDKATLTVTAVDKSKTYGEANPELTISYDGFVGSDSKTDIDTPPTATTSATTTSGAGAYAIIVSGGVDDNYDFSYTNGTLTIGKAILIVTANNQSKTYGDANPELTISYDGFVGDDGKTDIETLPTATTSATTTSDAGDYPINASGGTDNNYVFNYTSGTLTIGKAILTVTGAEAQNKTYDGTTNAVVSGAVLSGVAFGDLVELANSTVGTFDRATVGTEIAVTTAMTLTGTDSGNYTLSQPSGLKADITGKELTITGAFSVSDREYNGTTDAVIATNNLELSGIEGDNQVTLDHLVISFETSSAGNGLTVSIISADLTGNDAGQYSLSLTGAPTTTASILSKEATLAGATGISKTYDGNTLLPSGETAYNELNGILSEDLSQVAITGNPLFDSPDAGPRTIEQGGLTLTGPKADNYTLKWSNGSGTIEKASLTVTVNNDAKFVTQDDNSGYAGISISGYVNGEDVSTIDQTNLTITRNNTSENSAGEYSDVLSATGLTAANYTFTYLPGDYSIIPAHELLVEVNNLDVTYSETPVYSIKTARYLDSDGNTIKDLTANVTELGNNQFDVNDGVGGTVNFTVSEAEPQYNTFNNRLVVGSYQLKTTAVTGSSSNFNNTIHLTGALTVNTKGVDVQLSAGSEQKAFDGDANMDNLNLEIQGVVAEDDVTVPGVGYFIRSEAGTDIPYSVTFALEGEDKGNYHLTSIPPLTGTDGKIAPVELVVTGAVAENKVYDGTIDAVISGAKLEGVVTGDDVVLENGTFGTFDQSTVGTGIEVTTAMTLSGHDKDNYILISPSGLSADITPAELTVAGSFSVENKIYDGTVDATIVNDNLQLEGVISDDEVSLSNVSIAFVTQNAGTGIQLVITSAKITGPDTTQYTFSLNDAPVTYADIIKKELRITADNQTKEFDGAVYSPFTVSYDGFIADEDESELSGTLTFSGSATTAVDAGKDYVIIPGGLGSTNYNIVYVNGALDIDKINQTISFSPVPQQILRDATFELSATASSGLTVEFSSSDESVATVSGTTVTFISDGTCTIYADQPGNNNYNAAQQQLQTLTIIPYVAGDTNHDGTITAPEIAGDTDGNGQVDNGEIAGDTNGDGIITAPEIAGDTDGNGQINNGEIAGDTNGDGIITAPEIAGDTDGNGQIDNGEVAGDTDGDGKITAPEIAGDTDGNGQIDNEEVAGDSDGNGEITTPEMAGDSDGNGQIDNGEVAGDTDGDGKITAPEIAGDTDGNGQIDNGEVAGDTDGDGEIIAPEIAGDTDGNGQIDNGEIAGDTDGDGEITAPEIAGDTDGNGQVDNGEVAGDTDGDGKITAPEIAGDTDGNGQIDNGEVAGDSDGNGEITTPEMAGDSDGNGQIDNGEVAGDTDGDGKITALEIAGDTDGNGQIDNGEVAGDTDGDGEIIAPEIAGDTDGNGQIDNGEVAGDTDGDGKITVPEIAGDSDGNGQIDNGEVAGDSDGNGEITAPEIAGDTDGNGQIDNGEVAGDTDGDGEITAPEIAGDTDGNGQIDNGEVAGDTDGDGKITAPEIAGDTDGNGQIDNDEVAGDTDGDGEIIAPEIAGDTDGNGQIDNGEVAGDTDGDGEIIAPEIAGDTDGNGQIDNGEVAGDTDGDGKITAPEIAGDTDGNGQIDNGEVAGDTDGDGEIIAPEIAGDTDGNGQIDNGEVAGDTDGDGKITVPEIAGDSDGNGQIDNGEVAGDIDGNGEITAPEIAGDTDGNGQIDNGEVAGDADGDGEITAPEIAGDTDGNGQIDNGEVAGDTDGDGEIIAPEIAGDTDGNGQIDNGEVAGDTDGDGEITVPEIAGDTDGNGQVDNGEVAGDTDGDGKITAPEIAGDTDGNGQVDNGEVAGDTDGDGKITAPEIAGDTDGNGQVDNGEVAGDTDGDGKITAPEIAGDNDGNGQVDNGEVAGDTDGDGEITAPEIAGDTDGNGQVDNGEVAGDTDGDGKITAPEIAGDTDGNGQVDNGEVAGDTDGDGKITAPEIAGDTDGNGQVDNGEVAGDTDGDGKITAPEIAGDTDGNGQVDNGEVAGDIDGNGEITAPEIAGDTDGNGQVDNGEVAGDTDGDGKITAPEIAGDTDGNGQVDNGEVAGDTDGDGKITAPEIAGDTDGNGQVDNGEVAGDIDGDGEITAPEIAGDTDGNGQVDNGEVAGDTDGDGEITAPEIAGDIDGNGQVDNGEVAGDTDGDGKIIAPEIAGDTDGNGQIDNGEIAGDTNGDGITSAPEIVGDTDGNGQIDNGEVAGDTNGDGKIGDGEVPASTVADISILRINGETIENPDENIYYLVDCGDTLNYVSMSFELESYATSSHLASFKMATPVPGIYNEDITVVSGDSSKTRTYHVMVEKRFNFEDIIVQKYNNILLVNNNPETNGGYRFSSFNWYKDGQLVGTGQYYSVGDDVSDQLDWDAEYSVEMETEDGELLQTCEFAAPYSTSFNLKVAPNPVEAGSIVNIATTYTPDMLKDMNITVKNLYGRTVMQQRAGSNTSWITLPPSLAPGTYIVTTEAGGVVLSTKVIIQ